MITLLLFWSVLSTGCAAPASSGAEAAKRHEPSATVTASDLFPEPKAGISIHVEPGKDMKLDELLAEFSKATGLHFVVRPEIKGPLKAATTGLLDSIEIPKGEVYRVVESLLLQNDFVLTPLTHGEPRLFAVDSLSSGSNRGSLRNCAIFVPASELGAYARHPAILVSTMVNLPSVDVRTLSNSMRTMFTDANTQQIIPIGNSNSLMITGFGSSVASIVEMLKSVDDAARRDAEDAAKRAKERPNPPGAETPVPSKDEAPK